MFRKGPSDLCVLSGAALPSVNRLEAPKQGSAQVEVMKGTGGDKMGRGEGGREGEAESRPAQTNALTRKPQQEKRQEVKQWHREKWSTRCLRSRKLVGTVQRVNKFASNSALGVD